MGCNTSNTSKRPHIDGLDVHDFAKSHSWYKHLPVWPPTVYYAVPACGQQVRQPIHHDKSKPVGMNLHWHFVSEENIKWWTSAEVAKICMRFPIYVNCMLSGGANPNIILRRNYEREGGNIWKFAKQFHPNLYAKLEPHLIAMDLLNPQAQNSELMRLELCIGEGTYRQPYKLFHKLLKDQQRRQCDRAQLQLKRLRRSLSKRGFKEKQLLQASQATNKHRETVEQEIHQWNADRWRVQSAREWDDSVGPPMVVVHP